MSLGVIFHIWVSYKSPWASIGTSLNRYGNTWPPWKTGAGAKKASESSHSFKMKNILGFCLIFQVIMYKQLCWFHIFSFNMLFLFFQFLIFHPLLLFTILYSFQQHWMLQVEHSCSPLGPHIVWRSDMIFELCNIWELLFPPLSPWHNYFLGFSHVFGATLSLDHALTIEAP